MRIQGHLTRSIFLCAAVLNHMGNFWVGTCASCNNDYDQGSDKGTGGRLGNAIATQLMLVVLVGLTAVFSQPIAHVVTWCYSRIFS